MHVKTEKIRPSKIIAFYTILTLITCFMYKCTMRQPIFTEDTISSLILHAIIGLFIALPIIFINYFLLTKTRLFEALIQSIKENIQIMDRFEMSTVALFSGIGEEILFRGIVQHFTGLIVASLLFGLLHIGPNKKFLPWTFFALIMGFFLGLMRLYFGSLVVPIFIHATVNYASFRFLFSMDDKALS